MMTRKDTLSRLRDQVARGIPIIGAGAGTGISAKCEELGGADLIIIYNSGRFRMAGRGSIAGLMPYGDANQIVVEMAREVIPVVKNIPVLAGVCGTDPFRLMPNFLDELKRLGFQGVQNFPTVGLFEGRARRNMEETGMGYDREVEMIRIAHELDLLTTPYVFNPSEAMAMAKAGADIIVAHVGTTLKGTIGAQSTVSLDDSIVAIQAMHDAAKEVNPDVLVICHGGPIAEPEDVEYLFERTNGIVGFYGASSMERLPVEKAIIENTKRFKKLQIQKGETAGKRSTMATPDNLLPTLIFFNEEEAGIIEAISARIIPGNPSNPGAKEAEAVIYIDRALAGFFNHLQTFYREGIAELDRASRSRFESAFLDLNESQQDEFLRSIEGTLEQQSVEGALRDGQAGRLSQFFAVVYQHILEGTFGDPIYGGNRDAIGWKMVGFPGAQWSYTAEQMRLGFDVSEMKIASLADPAPLTNKSSERGAQ
jgi:predicted TIM-barrel enzyme